MQRGLLLALLLVLAPSARAMWLVDSVASKYNSAVEGVQSAGQSVASGYNSAVEGVQSAGQSVASGYNSAVEGVQSAGQTVASGYNTAVDAVGGAAYALGGAAWALAEAIDSSISSGLAAVQSTFDDVAQQLNEKLDAAMSNAQELLKKANPATWMPALVDYVLKQFGELGGLFAPVASALSELKERVRAALNVAMGFVTRQTTRLADNLERTIDKDIRTNFGQNTDRPNAEMDARIRDAAGPVKEKLRELRQLRFAYLSRFADNSSGLLQGAAGTLRDRQCSLQGGIENVFAETAPYAGISLTVPKTHLTRGAREILESVKDQSGYIKDTVNHLGEGFLQSAGHMLDQLASNNLDMPAHFFPIMASVVRRFRSQLAAIFNAVKTVDEPCGMCRTVMDRAVQVAVQQIRDRRLGTCRTASVCYLREGCRFVSAAAFPFMRDTLKKDICADLDALTGILIKRLLAVDDSVFADLQKAIPVGFICEELDYCKAQTLV